jgi:hypothetical protein
LLKATAAAAAQEDLLKINVQFTHTVNRRRRRQQ